MHYTRTIEEIKKVASHFWPSHLAELERSTSVIPILLQTQEKFLSILSLCDKKPDQVFELLRAADFKPNIFLKHLVVLADFGGEMIQRLNNQFDSVFGEEYDGMARLFRYTWRGKEYAYKFKAMPVSGVLNNNKLHIDGPSLATSWPVDDLMCDMIMILLHGASSLSTATEVLNKCEIGGLLGNPEELAKYVSEKYIWVSRITGGAQANTLGQVAQKYVEIYLKKRLGGEYCISSNGTIKGITQNDGRTLISFDLVVSKGKRAVGVEITFQVTTNSTIERKAGQAVSRYKQIKDSGNYLAYIIDGAGNFQRHSAVSTLCSNSDCTVAYTDKELDVLISFMKDKLK